MKYTKINSLLEVNEIILDIMRQIPDSDRYEYYTNYYSYDNKYSVWICSHSTKLIFEYDPFYPYPYIIRWFIEEVNNPPYKCEFSTKQELMDEFAKWIKVFPNPPE